MSGEETVRAAWMDAPETRAVTTALTQAGCAVRFVGGCVRDTLVGRPIADIDIATDALPDKVMDALHAAGLKVIPTGIDHGTVTAVAGGKPFEITTLRRDVETDGRRATVQFTDDWEADAARRDLTMNAISLEPDGTIHDPFGGRSDLAAGRVRFVGAAHDRIVEDVLRLLRYFRFYAHYGAPPPDEEALAACRGLAHRLATLSGERVRTELIKLLQAPDPMPSLRFMRDTGVFEQLLPKANELSVLERLVALENQHGVSLSPMRRLAVLCTEDSEALSNIADRLRLSSAERGYLVDLQSETVSPDMDTISRRRLIYRLGAELFRDLILLCWARNGLNLAWPDLLHFATTWVPKPFPLTGEDVLSRGVEQGPAVGDLLRAVELWWIDGDFSASRAECLAQLDRNLVK